MAPKLIKEKLGPFSGLGYSESKAIGNKNQSWQVVSSQRLSHQVCFPARKGEGAILFSEGCAKSTRDIIAWKGENSREAMMLGRERQHASHHLYCQVSEKPVESPLQGTWDAHQWAQGGRRGRAI